MSRTGRLTWSILGAVLITSILNLKAESIDAWLLGKIERDEQQLTWALRGENGYSVELLPSASRWSEPFFLEHPSLLENVDVGTKYLADLDDYFGRRKESGHLAGGYLYRIKFGNGSALYALSAEGGRTWFSPAFDREIEIAPRKVWAGGGGADFAYATILSGVPPRLVLFDENGEVKEERRFDLSDPDLASKIKDAENQYSSEGEPALEMISLAEYLREDDPSWRNVEITSVFNFRNQHERPEEIERIAEIEKLTRDEAKSELQSSVRQRNAADGLSDTKIKIRTPRNPSPANEAKRPHHENTKGSGTITWPLLIGSTVILGLVVILIRALMRGRAS